LNPEYIAKSYFPGDLLRSGRFTSVGSRPKRITPEKRSGGRELPRPCDRTVSYGNPARLPPLAQQVGNWQLDTDGARQLPTIEEIAVPAPAEKLIHVDEARKSAVFEVVLHAGEVVGEETYIPLSRNI